jgi:hypothetical protein
MCDISVIGGSKLRRGMIETPMLQQEKENGTESNLLQYPSNDILNLRHALISWILFRKNNVKLLQNFLLPSGQLKNKFPYYIIPHFLLPGCRTLQLINFYRRGTRCSAQDCQSELWTKLNLHTRLCSIRALFKSRYLTTTDVGMCICR